MPSECLSFIVKAGGTAASKFVLRNDNATTVEIELSVTPFVMRGGVKGADPHECEAAVRFLDAHGDEVSSPVCLAAFQCVELWIEITTVGDCWCDCAHWDAVLSAKGCGVCHTLCLDLFVSDGCVPEAKVEPTPKPEPCPPSRETMKDEMRSIMMELMVEFRDENRAKAAAKTAK